MRFKILFALDSKPFGNILPANYQYELSGWIYHTLANGDIEYSEWLHKNGYTKDRKQFRLFTFSNLQIPKLRMEGDRLILLSDNASVYLSFLPEKATEEFIKGIFSSQTFVLGDRHSRVQFRVQSVELLSPPKIEPTINFRTLSPIVLSGHLPNGNTTYISPDSPDTYQIIYDNLCSKYQAFYGKTYEKTENITNQSVELKELFKLTTPLKRKKITIKAQTPQQTYIVGYNTSFSITLPPDLMHILYETGVGEKNSMGFGMVEDTNYQK